MTCGAMRFAAGLLTAGCCICAFSEELKVVSTTPVTTTEWKPAVQPKELSEQVKKGLAWLIKHQHEDGSWGQGEESAQMGGAKSELAEKPNVADTCMSAMALLRAGNTPKEGEYAKNLTKAIEFICGQIEKSDDKGLFITELRGTRTQSKLGQFIDTFSAAHFLTQVRDKMPDEASTKRVKAAMHKVMDKIEKNQRPDGTWDNQGWAPALSQSMATKALNSAAQRGEQVDEDVRRRAEDYAKKQSAPAEAGKPRVAATGSAGIELYARASNISDLQESVNTNLQRDAQLKADLGTITREEEELKGKDDATSRQKLDELGKRKNEVSGNIKLNEQTAESLKQSQEALVKRLDDERFVQGFGSNGGEEFLSYMNIGESLVIKGDDIWKKWDEKTTANLNRVQNADGSWSGHHCITGRTFCTSAALLVLTVDRSPVPVAKEMARR